MTAAEMVSEQLAATATAVRQAQRALNEGRYPDANDSTLAACNAATAAMKAIMALTEALAATVSA